MSHVTYAFLVCASHCIRDVTHSSLIRLYMSDTWMSRVTTYEWVMPHVSLRLCLASVCVSFYVWRDSFYAWHDSFVCDVTHSSRTMCDVTHSMRDMTHSYVTWLIRLVLCVTWLILCVTWLIRMWRDSFVSFYVWRDSFYAWHDYNETHTQEMHLGFALLLCASRYMCDVTHSIRDMTHSYVTWLILYVTWLIHMWYDSF